MAAPSLPMSYTLEAFTGERDLLPPSLIELAPEIKGIITERMNYNFHEDRITMECGTYEKPLVINGVPYFAEAAVAPKQESTPAGSSLVSPGGWEVVHTYIKRLSQYRNLEAGDVSSAARRAFISLCLAAADHVAQEYPHLVVQGKCTEINNKMKRGRDAMAQHQEGIVKLSAAELEYEKKLNELLPKCTK